MCPLRSQVIAHVLYTYIHYIIKGYVKVANIREIFILSQITQAAGGKNELSLNTCGHLPVHYISAG